MLHAIPAPNYVIPAQAETHLATVAINVPIQAFEGVVNDRAGQWGKATSARARVA